MGQIACQQVLVEDASVFSVQWLDFPTAFAPVLSPRSILTRYLQELQRFTFSLVHPSESADGVRMLLAGTGLSLITLTPPEENAEGEATELVLHICGGVLVAQGQGDRGTLRFRCEPVPGGVRVSLQLADFCPLLLGAEPSRWRKLLYRCTQAYIHRKVTVRFLAGLYRELVDSAARLSVRQVRVREGEDT